MNAASIDVRGPKGPDDTTTIDLDGLSSYAELVAAIWAEMDPDGENSSDELLEGLIFTDPQGFAVHLFTPERGTQGKGPLTPIAAFDDVLKAWSDERDDDRREAMADYLDNGNDDLDGFEDAYEGKYKDGADFAEQLADNLGAVSEDNARWICIDWEATWDRNLRHDYWISDNGHVFRN